MIIYLKTDNIHAAINTALSCKAVMECEVILDSSKRVKNDLWTLGEVDETTLKAGDLVTSKWTKKCKVYEGTDTVMSIGETLKKYHVLRLSDKTVPMWWDFYNRFSKSIGGCSTQWL